MKLYLYYIKIKILESLTYKYEFFMTIAKQFFFILLTALFWKALYQNSSDIGGVTVEDMLVYSVLSVFLQNFFSRTIENQIRQRMRSGNIAIDYIKPVNLFAMYFANDVGNIVVNLVQRFIPVLLFSMVFIIVPVPVSVTAFLLFLISSVMSFFILWIFSAIFGLLYFWFTDTGNIGGIKDYIINILSGALVPVWFFPESLQQVLVYMPFIYTYQLPISIFIGKTGTKEAFTAMGIQVIWCVIFFIIFHLLSRKALKKVLVQGG